MLRTASARRSRRSLRSGYAFAHQEGFGKLITSGKIMRKTVLNFGKSSQSSSSGNNNASQSVPSGGDLVDGNSFECSLKFRCYSKLDNVGSVTGMSFHPMGENGATNGSSALPARHSHNGLPRTAPASTRTSFAANSQANSRQRLQDPYAITVDPETHENAKTTLPNSVFNP